MPVTLRVEDLIFVSGTTMTAKWAMVAYQGRNNSREWAEEHVENLFGHAHRDATQPHPRADDPGANVESHYGTDLDLPDREDSQDHHQCLFIHYYKVKRRVLKQPVVIEAAAGPHDVAPGPPNHGPETSQNTTTKESTVCLDELATKVQ